jgi:hypothetical protein
MRTGLGVARILTLPGVADSIAIRREAMAFKVFSCCSVFGIARKDAKSNYTSTKNFGKKLYVTPNYLTRVTQLLAE